MMQLTPFTFVLDWTINCQFAGLIWAQVHGLYIAEGLTVRLLDPRAYPESSTLDAVLENEPAAGCMEDNLVVRAALAGKGVKAIGAMLQQTPMVLMTDPNRGMNTLSDLPGRRVGMHRDGIHLLRTVLTLHGIDPNTVDFRVDGWTLNDLVAGRLDAVQGYTVTEPTQLAALGLIPHLIPVRHHRLHPYAQMMFTTERCLSRFSDPLRRFMRATFDGWRQALTHIDEAAELVAAASSEQEDPAVNRDILRAMVPLVTGEVGLDKIGTLDQARWERNLATYHQFGLIDRLPTVSEVVDSSLID